MNKLTIAFAFIIPLVFISCKNEKKTPKKNIESFTIKGHLQDITLKKVHLYHNKRLLKTATVVNDTFSFSGSVITPVLYTVKSDSLLLAKLAVENTTSHLFITPNSYIAYGGKIQKKINTYKKNIAQLEHKRTVFVDSFQQHYKTYNIEKFITDIASVNAEKFDFSMKTLTNTSLKPIQQFIFKDLLSYNNTTISQLEMLKNNSEIEPRWKNLVIAKIKKIEKAQEEIKQRKKKKKMLARRLAPIFTGESLNGGDLTSTQVIQGKKRILIDFWASWCGPCRQITPQVKYLYQKYKSKGFDIITISEDKTKDAWKNGIQEDGMIWHHIYDDDMRIAYMFNVLSIPHMVLLDERGGIIKDKISLTELERELKNTFGE